VAQSRFGLDLGLFELDRVPKMANKVL